MLGQVKNNLVTRFRDFIYFIGGITNLAAQSMYWVFMPPYERKRIFEQAKKAGVDSLPIVALISFFIGVILAFQISTLMQRLGSEMYIASVVALSLVRELGPIITSLVVAGRVGAAITAELGSMQVTEQIDALETLAIRPVRFLAVPRVVAATVMLPVITVIANLIAILGGMIVAVSRVGLSVTLFNRGMKLLFDSEDVYGGLLKSMVFGTVIAVEGCFYGFQTTGGAEGVGVATTKAVVASCVMILVLDYFLAEVIFRLIFPPS